MNPDEEAHYEVLQDLHCQLEKTIIEIFADEIVSSAFWRLSLRAPETKIAKCKQRRP